MGSAETKTRVDIDQRHGTALGVTTTPTIFINKQAVPPPSLNAPGLQSAIDDALKAKSETQ
jgi:protein-disulfide isomerase